MGLQQIPSKGGIPSGNTASRPSNPVIGDTYYDGTLGFLMIYDGTNFIACSAPALPPTIAVTDVGTSVAYGTVQASVAFTENANGGKAATFTATQGSTTSTSASSPIVLTVSGNPGSYSFTGTASNGFGTSASSVSVSQTLTSVPVAPTIGTATATGNSGEISLTFSAGSTGGSGNDPSVNPPQGNSGAPASFGPPWAGSGGGGAGAGGQPNPSNAQGGNGGDGVGTAINTAVGELALRFNTTGNANSALVICAITSNTTGEQNTAIG